MDCFEYTDGDRMTNDAFGGPSRQPESRITRREMDLAASIQEVTEEVVLGLARHAAELTGARYLCLAGGVALNCVANGKLLRRGTFDDIWIQPAAGDAGGALGCALAASYERFGVERTMAPGGLDAQSGSYLGPDYSEAKIQESLDDLERGVSTRHRPCRAGGCHRAGARRRQIVGHFSGRAAFGPRALGGRSILGDPRRADTQVDMNVKIKYRESFRPFAPSVLRERTSDYFELDRGSPYMLLVAPIREDRQLPMSPIGDSDEEDMLQLVAQARSDIPAVTHVDYSACVQSVDEHTNPQFHDVIKAFEARTGCGVVVNTSFNVRSEPIVGSPEDAYLCFMRTGMDMLVIDDFLLVKSEQPDFDDDESGKSSMNWTDRLLEARTTQTDRLLDARIRRVWRKKLEPAAVVLGARGVEFLGPRHDADTDSFYTPIEPGTPHFVEIDDVERALADMWQRDGLPELAAVGGDIAALVERLKDKGPQPSQVTSDVYAMY